MGLCCPPWSWRCELLIFSSPAPRRVSSGWVSVCDHAVFFTAPFKRRALMVRMSEASAAVAAPPCSNGLSAASMRMAALPETKGVAKLVALPGAMMSGLERPSDGLGL